MSRKAKLLEKTKMFKVLERNEIFTETQVREVKNLWT